MTKDQQPVGGNHSWSQFKASANAKNTFETGEHGSAPKNTFEGGSVKSSDPENTFEGGGGSSDIYLNKPNFGAPKGYMNG